MVIAGETEFECNKRLRSRYYSDIKNFSFVNRGGEITSKNQHHVTGLETVTSTQKNFLADYTVVNSNELLNNIGFYLKIEICS